MAETPMKYPAARAVPAVRSSRSLELVNSLLGGVTFVLMLLALYLALIYAPPDATQGNVQRIFYFHVPVAWVAFLAFGVVFVASILYLWKRSELMDAVARSSAEIGLLFTTLMLITGSLWGKPIWGTWWTWSPQLTTSLILWFIYLGYMMLRAYAPTSQQGARYAAVLGILGFFDVPIIYMAAQWWRDIHPGKVIEPGKASMPGSMLLAFLVSFTAFTLLYVWLLVNRVRIQRLQDRVIALEEELNA